MNWVAIITTLLFIFTYSAILQKHGQERPNFPLYHTLIGLVLIQGLYFWAGFYRTFENPQKILLLWDTLGMVWYFFKRVRDVKTYYNQYTLFVDATVTFTCLVAGGFYRP